MAFRYWYTDRGAWAAHSREGQDWIWTRDGRYFGYQRGDVVHHANGAHIGFVWQDGLRLVRHPGRGNYGNAWNRGNPGSPGNPGNPGSRGSLASLPSSVTNLFE